jgi:ParB-like chromosome segregation protein Spo0J
MTTRTTTRKRPPTGKTLAEVFAAEEPTLTLADLTPDAQNARTHTAKNIGMIADSLRAVGAARSIVVDEDNVVLAGNGLCEAAAEAGITKVKVVDVDGETVVAVRRRNLSPEQKRKLALYDNRTAELATWNVELLKDFAAEGFDLAPFEFADDLLADRDAPASFQKVDETLAVDHICPKCGYKWSGSSQTRPASDD